MNKWIGIGRLTGDPVVTFSADANTKIAKYSLAVDRGARDGADFLRVVAFGKLADFTENYLKKGIKVAVSGRIQTGSYKDKDGKTVYTTDIIAETQEFCEKKEAGSAPTPALPKEDEFMNIPEGIDEELPFT